MRLPFHDLDPRETDDGTYSVSVTGGVAGLVDASSGLDSVIVTVVNGVPMLMFDADSTPVTTEVPS